MPRPADAGDTLVEILVALAVLGIAIVALVGALGTNITTTVVNRDQAQAHALLGSAAEQVKAMRNMAFACPGGAPAPLSTTLVPRPAAFDVTYGPAEPVDGVGCGLLIGVPVRVTGGGYDLSVIVVKRP